LEQWVNSFGGSHGCQEFLFYAQLCDKGGGEVSKQLRIILNYSFSIMAQQWYFMTC